MAVWAEDWRDQIWMKLINLILFCFNKVQKSISWNLLGFKIYKYSQNYYTHQMLYQKKKIQYIFIHQVKDSSTFIFLASIQQMSNKWFFNKMHNISKQIEFAKTWFVYTLQSVSALGLLLLIKLSLSFQEQSTVVTYIGLVNMKKINADISSSIVLVYFLHLWVYQNTVLKWRQNVTHILRRFQNLTMYQYFL